MCLRFVCCVVSLMLLFRNSKAANRTNCSEGSICSTDVKQLSSHVVDNHASPTGRTATKEEDVNNEKDNLPTIATGVFCCKNETPSGLHSNQFEDQTQREEGMPLWAITILSVSVVLGVVGVAILVVFIFSTFNQKDVPDANTKSAPTDNVSNFSTTNGVIARSRGLNHSCTVIVDMENTDNALDHNNTSSQHRATSICLHTSDKRIIDVPLSEDGYAIPCDVQPRDVLPEISNTPNPTGDVNSSQHDYEELSDDSEDNTGATETSTFSYPKSTTSDTRHTIPRQLGGFHGFSLPYAKVNLSMKKDRQQIGGIRARLSSHQSELSYADLDFRTATSPDLVPLSPTLDGQCSDFDPLKLTTRASTIDYGELEKHRGLLQAFITQNSDSEIDEGVEDEFPEEEKQHTMSVTQF